MYPNNKILNNFEGSHLLENAVDNHIHCCPHINNRSVHIFEAVRHANACKMKAIGLMDNFSNSSGYAALVNKELNSINLEVFGGLIMEPYAGGVSVEAVKVALKYNYGDNLNTTKLQKYNNIKCDENYEELAAKVYCNPITKLFDFQNKNGETLNNINITNVCKAKYARIDLRKYIFSSNKFSHCGNLSRIRNI